MAGLFQPQLQTQIQAERPVVDESAASAIGAVTNLAAGYFKSVAQSKPSGPTYKQVKLEKFSTTLNNLQQKAESGQVPQDRILADLSIAAQQVATVDVPEALKAQYEQLSGKPFDAFSYDDPEEFQNAQLLKTDFAIGMRPSAVSALEAEGKAATPEAVDAAVLGMVEEKNFLGNQFEVQRQRRAMGLPVETTPLLENLKSDYTTFLNAVKAAQGDSIVEQSEYRNLEFSVNKLIATKYAGFESNPEINGVIKQMNGLLDDIGKGVSSTPSAVLADKIQLSLQNKEFNDLTIAVTRGLLEKDPDTFEVNMLKNAEGETVADALVTLLKDASLPKPVIDIFDSNVTPTQAVVSGVNPSSFEIPTVKENPKEYQLVVEKFSEAATTTDPNRLINNPRARNNWITTMNVVGNAVSSQSDEYILGEKLLSVFASNGVVKNLDIIYRTDPQNAAQTNDVLQQGLVAERVRQSNELNNRLEAGVGAGQLILTTPSGELQLNNDLIGSNAASLPGGVAKWNEMRGKIEAAGGLEAFLKLPKLTFGKGANVDASIMVDGNVYFLSDLFGIEFNRVVKLTNNLKMIDTKLGDLEGLATKYPEETDRLRGKTSSTSFDVTQLSGQTTKDLIATAESALGLNEDKQKNILANYLSAGGIEIDPSQTAWCASFVNATLAKTGLDGTGALNARSFLNWGTEITTPQLGDVVVLSRGSDPAKGHVGFFKGFDADGNILILGGNQGDSVSVNAYNKDRLLGYRRPDGATGIGTEAGLSQAIYRSATDPSFLPDLVSPDAMSAAPVTSLRPRARPEQEVAEAELPEPVRERRTDAGESLVGDRGLVRVANSPIFDRDLMRFLQALKVDPEQSFVVADLDELAAAEADGRLKKGDKVVVGQGASAFVAEIE
jgi:uncharacterized protein (TIGR02594 family)